MFDMLCVLTTPIELHAGGLAPFAVAPDGPATFCCFFRDPETRTAFLNDLRKIAGGAPVAPQDADARTTCLADQYASHWRRRAPDEALASVIEWRTRVSQRGYHTYTLREGYPPYRAGCVISFEPLGTSELRAQLDRACEVLSAEQAQVMDVFGWGLRR